ncbi:MAG TPA: ABC transporter permease [Chitinophagaceae bacterium]|nr:ABC transporter permease [Chitinophagaceae bacterium]
MIKHLFKLTWNKKKQTFLLMTEIFVSFIVMFAVFTMVVFYYQNYSRERGFNYENVWNLGYDNPPGMQNIDSIVAFRQYLKQMIKAMPQVQDVSFSDANIPFGDANIETYINYNKAGMNAEIYTVDEDYKNTLNVQIVEGRWFTKQDDVFRERPVVINETLKKKVFGDENAVGKLITDAGFGGTMKVIGVIHDLKDKGDYVRPPAGYYKKMDTSYSRGAQIIIKVKPNADAAFESKLYKTLSNAIPNTSIDIKHMDKERIIKNTQLLVPVIVLFTIAGFLIINVALGLFGVLWYSINRRKSEIGLRRAIGASRGSISKQLMGEALALSTMSLLAGTFFAVQFPLLNVFNLASNTYLIANGLAVLFIYLLVLICSLYPSRQAAAIYPAEALHED